MAGIATFLSVSDFVWGYNFYASNNPLPLFHVLFDR